MEAHNNTELFVSLQTRIFFKTLLIIEFLLIIGALLVIPNDSYDYPNYLVLIVMLIYGVLFLLTMMVNIVFENNHFKQISFVIIAVIIYIISNLFFMNSLGTGTSFIFYVLFMAIYILQKRRYIAVILVVAILYYIITMILYWDQRIIIIGTGYYINRYISLIALLYVSLSGLKLLKHYRETIIEQLQELNYKNSSLEMLNKEIKVTKESLERQYDKIYQLAYFDSLTKLSNRSYFLDYLAKQYHNRLDDYTIMILDIDNLKYINDTYSYNVGDMVIYEVSKRLVDLLEEDVTISRIGGDEIAMLFSGDIDYEFIAEKIMMIFTQPLSIPDIGLQISVNIGVVNCKNMDISYEEALRYADIALVKAKNEHKSSSHYVVYNSEMSKKIYEEIHISKELVKAVANDEIQIVYQPKYDTGTKLIIGFEALARWQHEEMGFISPNKFIIIAEQYGFISQLTEYIVEKACTFARAINTSEEQFIVTINISGVDLTQENFYQRMVGLLYQTNTDPSIIGIEVTETAIMESLEMALPNLRRLREYGLAISLDDFGTGYSSLNYLRKLPIDVLKIDKSFIDHICTDTFDEYMIHMIVDLANRLGIRTMAEGVETEEQYNMLRDLNCSGIQGYYFSKPVSFEEAVLMIKSL